MAHIECDELTSRLTERICPIFKEDCKGKECAWFCHYSHIGSPSNIYYGECAITEISTAIDDLKIALE